MVIATTHAIEHREVVSSKMLGVHSRLYSAPCKPTICRGVFSVCSGSVARADYQDTELNINELHSTNKINGSTKGERHGNI
jgi:hypothetical protein